MLETKVEAESFSVKEGKWMCDNYVKRNLESISGVVDVGLIVISHFESSTRSYSDSKNSNSVIP